MKMKMFKTLRNIILLLLVAVVASCTSEDIPQDVMGGRLSSINVGLGGTMTRAGGYNGIVKTNFESGDVLNITITPLNGTTITTTASYNGSTWNIANKDIILNKGTSISIKHTPGDNVPNFGDVKDDLSFSGTYTASAAIDATVGRGTFDTSTESLSVTMAHDNAQIIVRILPASQITLPNVLSLKMNGTDMYKAEPNKEYHAIVAPNTGINTFTVVLDKDNDGETDEGETFNLEPTTTLIPEAGKYYRYDMEFDVEGTLRLTSIPQVGNIEFSGSIGRSVVISTAEDLKMVNNDPMGTYILANDIDLNYEDWAPLTKFSGRFDGNGHKIKNLKISKTVEAKFYILNSTGNNTNLVSAKCSGLFSGFGKNAIIHNLHIEGVQMNVTDAQYIGILAARAEDATISLCSVTGVEDNNKATSNMSVSTQSTSFGGLLGIADNCHISRCWIKDLELFGNKNTGSNATYVGGLISTIKNTTMVSCFAINPIVKAYLKEGLYAYSGGLLGRILENTNIYGCYVSNAFAEVNVAGTGNEYVGYFTGVNNATMTSCFATINKDITATPDYVAATTIAGSSTVENCVLDTPSDNDWKSAMTPTTNTIPVNVPVVVRNTGVVGSEEHSLITETRTFTIVGDDNKNAVWDFSGTTPKINLSYNGTKQ